MPSVKDASVSEQVKGVHLLVRNTKTWSNAELRKLSLNSASSARLRNWRRMPSPVRRNRSPKSPPLPPPKGRGTSETAAIGKSINLKNGPQQ